MAAIELDGLTKRYGDVLAVADSPFLADWRSVTGRSPVRLIHGA